MSEFPQIIWMFWNKGFENLPKECLACYNSYKINNPDWDINVLDFDSLNEFIDNDDVLIINKLKENNVSLNHISDVIRLCLLKKNGGVWADITTYCNISINEMLKNIDNKELIIFCDLNDFKIISSWWLYAKVNCKIIDLWYDKFLKYWKENNFKKSEEYYILHNTFEWLFINNPYFKSLVINNCLKFDRIEAHKFQYFGLNNDLDEYAKDYIDNKMTSPIYKLIGSWKGTKINKGNIIHYLFSKSNLLGGYSYKISYSL